jgi:hypothetical protein
MRQLSARNGMMRSHSEHLYPHRINQIPHTRETSESDKHRSHRKQQLSIGRCGSGPRSHWCFRVAFRIYFIAIARCCALIAAGIPSMAEFFELTSDLCIDYAFSLLWIVGIYLKKSCYISVLLLVSRLRGLVSRLVRPVVTVARCCSS